MRYANIEWRGVDNNQPYSLDFNDVYFNSENGFPDNADNYVYKYNNQLALTCKYDYNYINVLK